MKKARFKKNEYLKEMPIKDFQESGMLWFINRILHAFGWVIVLDINEKREITRMYPARCKFRGFWAEDEAKGYKNVSKYMVKNAQDILNEANWKDDENH